MLILDDIYDVYCDALVCDDGYLVFASLWGRDTAIQELLARVSLSRSEGGLTQLQFLDEHADSRHGQLARIGNPERLDKMNGRMPKSNLFGDIVHLWLFDKLVKTPDYASRQAYSLLLPGQGDQLEISWNLVRSVCHLPLLEHWRDAVLKLMRDQRWLKVLEGYRVDLLAIDIPEAEFDQAVSQMVRNGDLTIGSVFTRNVIYKPEQMLRGA